MTSTKLAAFRLDLDLIEGMEQVKREVGIPIAEQVRRALRAWLASHGVKAKSERRRVVQTRSRS